MLGRPPRDLSCSKDRVDDRLVPGAPAQVTPQPLAHRRVIRLRLLSERVQALKGLEKDRRPRRNSVSGVNIGSGGRI